MANSCVRAHALFGVRVAQHIVVQARSDGFRREAREERANIAAAVRHDPDFNGAGMATKAVRKCAAFAFVSVDRKRSQCVGISGEARRKLARVEHVVEMRMQGEARQRGFAQHIEG